MASIAIVTGAHLCRNPRVVKEAEALSAVGHTVTILRPMLDARLAKEDAELASGAAWTVQTTADLTAGRFRSGRARLVRRAATEATRRGAEWPEALGYGIRKTLRQALRLNADLTIGHQELGLWVANRLADAGRMVGVDLEDWYSEDLLPAERQSRPVRLLGREETAALRRGGHVTTTSGALAAALSRTASSAAPAVVYNAFPWSDREHLDGRTLDRTDTRRPSLHWVSQTVGPGRGLETLFEALRDVPTATDVHLRGACTALEETRLRALFPDAAGHRLSIHPLVPTGELLSRIAEHDIGLALEPPDSLSRDYTVTNKILHYLLGGLAVVATDTAGQQEIAELAPEAVGLCRADDPDSLAEALRCMLASPEALARAKQASLRAAEATFCWERQAPVLVASVHRALGETRHAEPA